MNLITAWRSDDPRFAADAKAFWAAHGLLPAGDADQRANELCAMAYQGGELVGLTTASFSTLSHLRSRFAMYRCAVAPHCRQHECATLLTVHTMTTLESWSSRHPEEKLMGLGAILQAAELRGREALPMWSDFNVHLNLVGHTVSGEQIRVAWFRHARLDV